MVGFIHGFVVNKDDNELVVQPTAPSSNKEANVIKSWDNIGYSLFVACPDNYEVGKSYYFAIYTDVREDSITLYAMPSFADRSLFKKLISVKGVGPKTALLILSLGVDEVYRCLRENDRDTLAALKGITYKNSANIIEHFRTKGLL